MKLTKIGSVRMISLICSALSSLMGDIITFFLVFLG
jgi:hypothetical protein